MIEKKLIKDLARRLVYYQIKGESVPAEKVFSRFNRLYSEIRDRHISGYRPLPDEVDLGIKFEYVVTRDFEDALLNVKDVLIVPVYGFNSRKYRLGRGGGFYDQLISSKKLLTIGIATEARQVEFIPEKHDMRLDYIVTEERTI